MTREDLKGRLDAAGISPGAYELFGERGGALSEVYVLERLEQGWAVYYAERGQRSDERWFAVETQACEHLLRRILREVGRA